MLIIKRYLHSLDFSFETQFYKNRIIWKGILGSKESLKKIISNLTKSKMPLDQTCSMTLTPLNA